MRYSPNNYTNALIGALEDTPREKKDLVLKNFVKLIIKTGDIKHSKKILEAVHKKLVNEKGGKWVDIEVARESALKKKLLQNKFLKKDHISFQINPELVAGVRITVNGEDELNSTLQNKLNKLFRI